MSMSHLTKREAMAIPAGLLFAFYLLGGVCTAPAVIAAGSADQIVRILFLLLFQAYLLAEILFSKEALASIPAFALTLLTPAAALVVAIAADRENTDIISAVNWGYSGLVLGGLLTVWKYERNVSLKWLSLFFAVAWFIAVFLCLFLGASLLNGNIPSTR